MKNIFIFLYFFTFSSFLIAQDPGKAFNPITASGAKRINTYNHILYWENPSGVTFNEIYISEDSLLVANLDPTVKLLSGYPDSVYSSMTLVLMDTVINGTWYYWRVVEHNQYGSNAGETWKFRTVGYDPYSGVDLSTGLNDWIIIDSSGFNNWVIDSDALFFNPFSFYGTSIIIYKRIYNYIIAELNFFTSYQHFFTGPFIGAGYTTDEGLTWNSLWEFQPTGNFSNYIFSQLPKEEVQIGFYFNGSSDGVLLWEISDINLTSIIYLLTPPGQLFAKADTDSQKVKLNWTTAQFTWPDTILSYRIERKEGLPNSSNTFSLIAEVPPHIFYYEDTHVLLNSVYTYRISTTAGSYESSFSNDATAYVPAVVPVELNNFTAFVEDETIQLEWTTSSEKNNYGFEIERSREDGKLIRQSVNEDGWEVIGFVKGKGTTTEQQFYSFIDKNLSAGKYKYRLKQIDLDGTYEYSNIVEAEINQPIEFSLSQNYPNPFNPVTKIRYTIPQDERGETKNVMLKIFDILGNEVVILVNEKQEPGVYEVEFNGSNLSSGIYFYKLTAGGHSLSKKMILAK